MTIPGMNVWNRIRMFLGLVGTDFKIQPPLAGGKLSVLQGGVAATGTNQVDISHAGTSGGTVSSGQGPLTFTSGTTNVASWLFSFTSGTDSGRSKVFIALSSSAPFTVNGLSQLGWSSNDLDASTGQAAAWAKKASGAISAVGSSLTSASFISVPDPTTDVTALTQTFHGSNAWGGATTNTTGGNSVITPGCGTRYLTVTNFASIAGGATVTVTVDGTATVLTNSSWNVTSNNQTATNIAAAINASGALNTSLVATASSARVYLVPNGNIGGVILATSDGTNLAVTSGTNGVVAIQYPGGTTSQQLRLSHDGTIGIIGNPVARGFSLRADSLSTTANLLNIATSNGCLDWYDENSQLTQRLGNGGVYLKSGSSFSWANSTSNAAATSDTSIGRIAAAVSGSGNGQGGAGWFQNTAGRSRVTTSDVTNITTTLANVTGLSSTVIAGRKYIDGWIRLYVQEGLAADGLKLDMNGGTATWTSFRGTYVVYDTTGATPIAAGSFTSIATAMTAATLTGAAWVDITYSGVCNAAGTLIPRQAKNSDAAGGTLTTRVDSFMSLEDCP